MEGIKRKRSRTFWRSIGFGGLGIFYVAFAGQGVTHLTSLGLTETQISITLLSGPICGAVLQPFFGNWSDRHQSRWGRRKPFIVIGAIWLIISMLCLAWARTIVGLFTSRDVQHGVDQTLLALFAMLSVFSMYAAVQAVQIGMRALVTDGYSLHEQADANAWAGRYIGLGGVVGNLVAFLDGRSRHIQQGEGRTVLMDSSIFATICLVLSLWISCACVSEEGDSASSKPPSARNITTQTISRLRRQLMLLKRTSSQFRMICLVQFLSWFGWFPFYFYAVAYVNNFSETKNPQIMANASKELAFESQQQIPRLGSLAFLTYSSFSLFIAILLPYLATGEKSSQPAWTKGGDHLHPLFTMRHIWMASHAVFGCCMLGTFWVTTAWGTVILFTLVGFSWAITNWVPYALLGAEISQQPINHPHSGYDEVGDGEEEEERISTNAGLLYGLHGLAICLPQIAMALLMGAASMLTGSKAANHRNLEIVWTFRTGGVFAFIAMFCTLWVRDLEDYGDHSHEIDESEEVMLEDF